MIIEAEIDKLIKKDEFINLAIFSRQQSLAKRGYFRDLRFHFRGSNAKVETGCSQKVLKLYNLMKQMETGFMREQTELNNFYKQQLYTFSLSSEDSK